MKKRLLLLCALSASYAFAVQYYPLMVDSSGALPEGSPFLQANAIAKAKRPCFVVALPEGYCDFEIKGTINNFTHSVSSSQIVYWYHSPDPQKQIFPAQKWTNLPSVYFTCSQIDVYDIGLFNDSRKWHSQSATTSIYRTVFKRTEIAATKTTVFGGLVIILNESSQTWCRAGNPNLFFSIHLFKPNGGETDSDGNPIWRPIQPIWVE